jgi:hypothetical protein
MYDYLPRSVELNLIRLARRANLLEPKIKYDGQIAYIGEKNGHITIRKGITKLNLSASDFSGGVDI